MSLRGRAVGKPFFFRAEKGKRRPQGPVAVRCEKKGERDAHLTARKEKEKKGSKDGKNWFTDPKKKTRLSSTAGKKKRRTK